MNDLTQTARSVFANDLYATSVTGIVIDSVEPHSAVCSLQLNGSHRNAKGAVMGGVLFTLADFTFAVAANTSDLEADNKTPHLSWVSTSSNIHFLSATKGSRLKATAHCVRQGRTNALYQIDIVDDLDKHIALITTSGTHV